MFLWKKTDQITHCHEILDERTSITNYEGQKMETTERCQRGSPTILTVIGQKESGSKNWLTVN